jgi:hypothetical protein
VPVKSPFRGAMVYLRKTWGTEIGQVDETSLYRVRSVGPKKVILDRVDKVTLLPNRRRGQTLYLDSKEACERGVEAQRNQSYKRLYYWDWSQVLVLQGEAGWDASQNY